MTSYCSKSVSFCLFLFVLSIFRIRLCALSQHIWFVRALLQSINQKQREITEWNCPQRLLSTTVMDATVRYLLEHCFWGVCSCSGSNQRCKDSMNGCNQLFIRSVPVRWCNCLWNKLILLEGKIRKCVRRPGHWALLEINFTSSELIALHFIHIQCFCLSMLYLSISILGHFRLIVFHLPDGCSTIVTLQIILSRIKSSFISSLLPSLSFLFPFLRSLLPPALLLLIWKHLQWHIFPLWCYNYVYMH